MSKTFTIAIQKENDWFVAKCLENSVASQGKTIDEVIDNLREAVALFYEDKAPPSFPQTFVTTLEVALQCRRYYVPNRSSRALKEMVSVLLSSKEAALADKEAALADKEAALADKNAEIERLRAQLEK